MSKEIKELEGLLSDATDPDYNSLYRTQLLSLVTARSLLVIAKSLEKLAKEKK